MRWPEPINWTISLTDIAVPVWWQRTFYKYVTVMRCGPEPDSEPRPDHEPSDLRPTDSAYWKRRGDNTVSIGHVFKYPYSYYDLLRRAGDPELERAWDEKAHHLF